MFGKRILNVEVYGDQTIHGIKNFKDQIVVPENSLYCYQIADIGTFITDNNFVTVTTLNTKLQLYATISSLSIYATLASPTFTGTVTLPDGATISANGSVYARKTTLNAYAPLASPTFTGTVSWMPRAMLK